MDVSYARQALENYSAKPLGSCSACRSSVNPRYDLEIIIPVFNSEQYLNECLESVFRQKTRFSYHVIAVNDGSTDSSLEILEKYASTLLSVINQENGGTAKARNAGLDEASGKYIMFVDSDDILPENAIEILMSQAISNCSDIVEGSADYFSDGVCRRYYSHENIADTDYRQVNACIWGKVFSADLFSSFSFPEGYWYEDTADVFVLYPMAHKVSTCSDVVYNYRINGNGMTAVTKSKTKALDTFWVTEECVSEYIRRGYALDEYFIKNYEKQLIVDYQRLIGFPQIIQKAVFVLSSSTVERLHIDNGKSKLLKEMAERYYNKYRLYCMLH